jgi:23S rRNA (uracil1939-C5)-methyltransferase
MKTEVVQQASILNLSHDGKGIARINGKATFIAGALPGEEVEFSLLRRKKDFDEGRLRAVLKSSPLRVAPKCPHFSLCGGCSFQHVDASEQIVLKQAQLLDLLARYGHTQVETLLPPLTANSWNYRNKARLSVRYVEKKQTHLIGFREANNPRYITEIDQCPVLHPKVDADLLTLRALLALIEDKHSIAQIEVAAGDHEVALIFRHLSPLTANDKHHLETFAQKQNYKIFLQPHGPESIHCFYPPNSSNYLHYELPDQGLHFQFHPSDFTQVNPLLNRAMVSLALSLLELKGSDRVLDLFCGLGNFSLPMAKYCSEVVGVEGSQTMVLRALMNAKANDLAARAFFYKANLDDPKEIKPFLQGLANKLLIDPPRSGAFEVVKHIELLYPECIVYVSCNPMTLARDSDILVNQKGYVLKKAGVMDMFPHTAHVESIALFERG